MCVSVTWAWFWGHSVWQRNCPLGGSKPCSLPESLGACQQSDPSPPAHSGWRPRPGDRAYLQPSNSPQAREASCVDWWTGLWACVSGMPVSRGRVTWLGWGPGGCVPARAAGPPRRRCLPAASGPGADVSLWNILRNNIGKDLSKVSMPVQLNEPLNTLQRLCEELEYSSLLDQASHMADPCERMVPAPGPPLPPRGPCPPEIPEGLILVAKVPHPDPRLCLRWGVPSLSPPLSPQPW